MPIVPGQLKLKCCKSPNLTDVYGCSIYVPALVASHVYVSMALYEPEIV